MQPLPTDIPDRLDQLAAVRDGADEMRTALDEIIRAAIEQAGMTQAVEDVKANIAEAERYAGELADEIKGYVLQAGITVRGAQAPIMAVFGHTPVKWNDDKLMGYAAAHPEVLDFRTPGKPTVSIRTGR